MWILFFGERREQLFPTYTDQGEYLLHNVPFLAWVRFQRILRLKVLRAFDYQKAHSPDPYLKIGKPYVGRASEGHTEKALEKGRRSQ